MFDPFKYNPGYEDDMRRGCIIGTIAWILIIVTSIWFLSSCSPKVVQVPTVDTHDTIYVQKLQKDSIYLHDSIYQETFIKGDTVIKYKYVQKTEYVDRLKTDSIYISQCDTITEHIITNEVTRWQHTEIVFGRLFLAIIIAWVILAALRWKK